MQDPIYFSIHRRTYIEELESLDKHVRLKVLGDSNCREAQLLAQRVDRKVKANMGSVFPIIDLALEIAAEKA